MFCRNTEFVLNDVCFIDEFKQQLADQQNLKCEIKRLQTELDESRSQLTVLSLDYQNKLDAETRKYQEELSSLQHLLTGNLRLGNP